MITVMIILEVLAILAAVPIGFLIANYTRDELRSGKIWFRLIIIASVFVGGWFFLIGRREVTLTAAFIAVVALISLMKASDIEEERKR